MKPTFILIFSVVFGITHGGLIPDDYYFRYDNSNDSYEGRRWFLSDMVDSGKKLYHNTVNYVKDLIEAPKKYLYKKGQNIMKNIYGNPVVETIDDDKVILQEVESVTTANGTQIFYFKPLNKKGKKKQKKPDNGGANTADESKPNAGPSVDVMDGMELEDASSENAEDETDPNAGPPVDVMDGMELEDASLDNAEDETDPNAGPPVDVMDGMELEDASLDNAEDESDPNAGPPVDVMDGMELEDASLDNAEDETDPNAGPPVDVMDGMELEDGGEDDVVDETDPDAGPPVDVMEGLDGGELDDTQDFVPDDKVLVSRTTSFNVLGDLDSDDEESRRMFDDHMFNAERIDDDHIIIDGEIFTLSDIMVPVPSYNTGRRYYVKYVNELKY